jgi:folylpolyglutamate synthase/dihydropteroate synthase
MLAALSALGDTIVATASSNERALPPADLAKRARPFFKQVSTVPDPAEAVVAARELAGDERAVLVTGSLYLLADLAPFRPGTALPWRR